MNVQEIELALTGWFGVQRYVMIPNLSYALLPYECDLAILTTSGYLYEIEIKVSKSDMIRDSKKHKWRNDYYNSSGNLIRKMWFAIPFYLERDIEYIPDIAGILIVDNPERSRLFGEIREIRKPKINKLSHRLTAQQQFRFARCGVFRMWNLKLLQLQKEK